MPLEAPPVPLNRFPKNEEEEEEEEEEEKKKEEKKKEKKKFFFAIKGVAIGREIGHASVQVSQ